MNEVEKINIPEKFQKIDRTFLNHLRNEKGSVFMPFPRNTSFLGKEDDESVVLILRKHWQFLLPTILECIFLLLLPFILSVIIPNLPNRGLFVFSLFLVSLLISLSLLIYRYVRWFYNVNIITDQRVIDMDFETLFSHKTTEARLEKVEDITFKQIGILSNLFDIGSIYIQTAGAKSEIEFKGIHNPKQVQDILSDLLESKKKGEI
ncbi:MAG TPA: PH domain-containing protein [Candidatus Dojkabacteria bacterium]|nr:PH domain-containing protein [Candidatus Dojkabacteria bacterium]HRZ84621.1 PH domain-containing protein [Candidatus Dojkabacteria bacterium]